MEGAGQVHSDVPGERYMLCFICSCQSDCLLLEVVQLHAQSDLKYRHTAGRNHVNWACLAVCQGFIKAVCVGRRSEPEFNVHELCVSAVGSFSCICGQCCKLLNQLYSPLEIVSSTFEAAQRDKTKPHLLSRYPVKSILNILIDLLRPFGTSSLLSAETVAFL